MAAPGQNPPAPAPVEFKVTDWVRIIREQGLSLVKQGPRPPGELGGVKDDVPPEYLGPRA